MPEILHACPNAWAVEFGEGDPRETEYFTAYWMATRRQKVVGGEVVRANLWHEKSSRFGESRYYSLTVTPVKVDEVQFGDVLAKLTEADKEALRKAGVTGI